MAKKRIIDVQGGLDAYIKKNGKIPKMEWYAMIGTNAMTAGKYQKGNIPLTVFEIVDKIVELTGLPESEVLKEVDESEG